MTETTSLLDQIPFGYAGMLIIAGILYFAISRIAENTLEKLGYKYAPQYKDLQTGINAPTWAWTIGGASIPIIASLLAENLLKTKTNWTLTIILTITLAITATAIGLTKGAGTDKKLMHA